MSEHNHVVDKDGDIEPGKVGAAISRIEPSERDRILRNFEEFKGYLHRRVRMAESIGMSEEQMAVIAQKVADYLSSHEEPRNNEELLLQELWKAGTEEERHVLAHMLLRLAQGARAH